jgi:hypothetical protein
MAPSDVHSSLRDRVPFLALAPPSPLSPRRVLRESLPIAGLLLFWTALSWLAFQPFVARAVRLTGVVTALAYVVVRGVRLGRDATPLATTHVGGVLGQCVRAAVAPAVWFVAGALVPVVADLWDLLGFVGLFSSPASDLVRVCALTGVGTAALVVTAGATAALDDAGSIPSSD